MGIYSTPSQNERRFLLVFPVTTLAASVGLLVLVPLPPPPGLRLFELRPQLVAEVIVHVIVVPVILYRVAARKLRNKETGNSIQRGNRNAENRWELHLSTRGVDGSTQRHISAVALMRANMPF